MAYEKVQAKRQFSRWSRSYDRSILQWLLFGPSHRAVVGRLRTVFGDQPASVLDIGCGTGVLASCIAEALPGASICGVDLVPEMIAGGRGRWETMPDRGFPVQGDSERLPFSDGAFDVVTCTNSFHHYPHQDRAVAEMRRVLKPGGRLLLLDGCRDNLWGWLIYDVCVTAVEGDVRHASAKAIRGMFRDADFAQVTQVVHRGPAPFLLTEGVAASASATEEYSDHMTPDLIGTSTP